MQLAFDYSLLRKDLERQQDVLRSKLCLLFCRPIEELANDLLGA
jgi:hypothetical protein